MDNNLMMDKNTVQRGYPTLVAHRGYAAQYPENTLLAIRAAVEAGATFVEFDIQLSADLVPVLFHDRNLQRMCGCAGSVPELSLVQLKTLSLHEFGKFGYKYVGNPITTLTELVEYLASQPQVTAFVELKRVSLTKNGIQTVLDKVLAAIAPIQTQCVIISYDLAALAHVRKQTSYPVGAVFDHWRERRSSAVRRLKPEYVFTDIDELPRFGKLTFQQSKIAVYECVDAKKALRVYRRGVDMVETFAIAEMLTQVKLVAGEA